MHLHINIAFKPRRFWGFTTVAHLPEWEALLWANNSEGSSISKLLLGVVVVVVVVVALL